MGRLEERVAIISGAGDGIGRGIARRFAAEGARVLIAEIDEDSGDRVAKELASEFDADARAKRIDVPRKTDIRAMVEAAKAAWATVRVLVNNAWGGETLCRVEEMTPRPTSHPSRYSWPARTPATSRATRFSWTAVVTSTACCRNRRCPGTST
jgi:NAD(P)-dependent dehydrogenase (short-subunit alcohol dehydrogenase family)